MHQHPTSDPAVRSRQNLTGLVVHWTVFLGAAIVLFTVNMATSPWVPWFLWSLLGWGLGVAMHTVNVLKFETLTEDEQRAELEREAARYRHRLHGRCGGRRRPHSSYYV